MSGLIIVLKVLPNLDKEPVWSFETGDMSWLDWHPGANVLFAGTADSSFWMWKIPSKIFFLAKSVKFLQIQCRSVLKIKNRHNIIFERGKFRLV